MAAETAKQFEALEAQAQRLMSVFIKAGYEAVAPSIIQPADVFLDVVGEQLRARTYVFTDAQGEELCLRPDLTVPACRLYLERHPTGSVPAQYCYNGAAFRFQPEGAGRAHPREFRQAGIESFGSLDREKAEADTVALVYEGLRSAGLENVELRLGDLGLFRALLKSLEMPERWRQLLIHRFWQPGAFRGELKRMMAGPSTVINGWPEDLIEALASADGREAERKVGQYLETQGIEAVGVRSLAEITERMRWIAADAKSEPLSAETASLIERYVAIRAPATKASEVLRSTVGVQGPEIERAASAFERRLSLLAAAGIDVEHADFSAEFGRSLQYYTGFVFEVIVPELGPLSPVAGGGRYDGLVRAVGAPQDVPAIGAAIHTERLLTAVTGAKL